jgi:alkanesulfonate monooxygenase
MTHPLQFIGFTSHRAGSEAQAPSGPVFDPDYVVRMAQLHEQAGFDRVLIAWHSNAPDPLLLAQLAASRTTRLGFMVAHRPGFIAPTVAARQFATFDQLSDGRAAIHVISGGGPADQQADGDWLNHDERYARTDEYVRVLKRVWTEDKPFDHEGPHYRVKGAFSAIKPKQAPHPTVFFGGSSEPAIRFAGQHADVYAFWGETLDQARETIGRVRRATAEAGRDPASIRFSLSFRPVLAGTEDAAWARADRILERVRALRGGQSGAADNSKPESVGSARLLEAAKGGRVRDTRMWTEVAAAVGAGANTTALVGTAEQVAESLHAYRQLGVDTFLIRGFDPEADAAEYGRDLLPAVRRLDARPLSVAAE